MREANEMENKWMKRATLMENGVYRVGFTLLVVIGGVFLYIRHQYNKPCCSECGSKYVFPTDSEKAEKARERIRKVMSGSEES